LNFLKKMSKYYEIIVFTASEKEYADSILNELDSQGLVRHKLFSRSLSQNR
jgi:TFIIF-interacting CTD phosphatase-like protein